MLPEERIEAGQAKPKRARQTDSYLLGYESDSSQAAATWKLLAGPQLVERVNSLERTMVELDPFCLFLLTQLSDVYFWILSSWENVT